MSDWFHNLPVLWMAVIVFGLTYLLAGLIHVVVLLKVKRNEPLTPTDLKETLSQPASGRELERIFLEAGVDETSLGVLQTDGGLPRFIRTLVGLDRQAAKQAFAEFLENRKLTADQLEFLNLLLIT